MVLLWCAPQASSCRHLRSNNFCSTVTHIVPPHAQAKNGRQPRESVVGVKKNALFARCSSSISANVALELDSNISSAKHQESGFNRPWQDEFPWFLFTREYALKIRLQLQILC